MWSSLNPIKAVPDMPLVQFHWAAKRLSRDEQWRLYIAALVVSDVLLIGLAFLFAYWVRFGLDMFVFQLDVAPTLGFYQQLFTILLPLWIAIFAGNSLYSRRNLLGGTQEYSRVFGATSLGMLLVIIAGFLEPHFILARGWLLLAWFFSFLLVGGGRFALRRLIYSLRRRGFFLAQALIIGANEEGQSLAQQLAAWRTSGLHVVGFVDNKLQPGSRVYGHLQTLGDVSHLDVLIRRYQVEELVLATSALTREEMLVVFKQYGMLDGLELRLSSGLFEIITTGLEVKEMAYVPLVRVNKVRLTGLDLALKLALDYALTIPGLIAILPLLAAIAVAVRLDSPGPIIYRRRVMGINGKQFDAYKFRTMRLDGDEILKANPELKAELARSHKLKNDPRITRVGRVLRQLSLDELPQLFNVLKREMSLVGPRMICPDEMLMYDEWGLNLLTVAPGITGLWQVSGRSDISYRERVRLDMHYIRNWTIWLDLHLLLQTIPAVVKGRGAY